MTAGWDRETSRRHDVDVVDDGPVVSTDKGDLGSVVGDAVATSEYHPSCLAFADCTPSCSFVLGGPSLLICYRFSPSVIVVGVSISIVAWVDQIPHGHGLPRRSSFWLDSSAISGSVCSYDFCAPARTTTRLTHRSMSGRLADNSFVFLDRALLVDTLSTSEQAARDAWAAYMCGLGSIVGFFVFVATQILSFVPHI